MNNCSLCDHYDPIDENRGICRIARPSIHVYNDEKGKPQMATLWPEVRGADWCGEFTPEPPAA